MKLLPIVNGREKESEREERRKEREREGELAGTIMRRRSCSRFGWLCKKHPSQKSISLSLKFGSKITVL